MIALHDDFKQIKTNKNARSNVKANVKANTRSSSKPSGPKSAVLAVCNEAASKIRHASTRRKERRQDKLALERLLQLDDALLKDMGIERRDLEAVKQGTLTLDALNKYGIVAARDNSSNTNFFRR